MHHVQLRADFFFFKQRRVKRTFDEHMPVVTKHTETSVKVPMMVTSRRKQNLSSAFDPTAEGAVSSSGAARPLDSLADGTLQFQLCTVVCSPQLAALSRKSSPTWFINLYWEIIRQLQQLSVISGVLLPAPPVILINSKCQLWALSQTWRWWAGCFNNLWLSLGHRQ